MAARADLAIIIRGDTRDAEGSIGRLKQSAGGLGGAFSGLGSSMGSVVTGFGAVGLAAQGVGAAFSGIKSLGTTVFGLGALNELEQVRASFNAFTKDAAQTEQIMAQVRTEAAKTPFEFGEMAKATASLMPVAKSSGQALMDLVKEAEILAASNPLEGLEGASFSLREAMTGDFTSIIERFNLSRSTINKLKDEGVPALEIVRRAMQEMGFDSDLIAAKAETLEGRWSTFKDTLTTLTTKMGEPIFDAMKEGLLGLQEGLEGNMPLLEALADAVAGRVKQAIDIGKDALQGLSAFFRQVFAGDLASAGQALKSAMENIGRLIVDAVEAWAKSFAAWVDGAEPGMLGNLGDLAKALFDWIQESSIAIVEKLATWAAAFLDWVGPKIPDLLRELGGLLVAIITWMVTDGLPTLIEKLGEWGLAFVEWIGPRIVPMLYELGQLEAELLSWIAFTALPAIGEKLLEWGAAFAAWVPGALLDLLFELGRLEVQFIGWIADRVADVARAALELGVGLVGGVRDGIADALGGFWGWLQESFVDQIPSFVRELLGIHSPSGVFADIGRQIVDGLRVGMEDRLPSIDDVISRLVGRVAAAGDVTDWLRAAMQIAGVGGSWLEGLARLVDLESSGNPRARNSQAVGGEHASGLLQTLPSTFRAYAVEGMGDIWNPIHNAVAAIRYIADTYGHVNQIPGLFGGGFRGYATGGIAWTPQLAMVAERGPELIVPLSRLRSGGGGTVTVNLNVYGSVIHERDLAQVVSNAFGEGLRQGVPIGGLR